MSFSANSFRVASLLARSLPTCLPRPIRTPPSQPPLYGGKAPAQQTGSATAGEYAPLLDSEKRPITAGGFVKGGPVIFKDISEKAGLTTWNYKLGTPQKQYILETIGSGAALID